MDIKILPANRKEKCSKDNQSTCFTFDNENEKSVKSFHLDNQKRKIINLEARIGAKV